MSEKKIKIKAGEEYMTLNVLLKITDTISTGGMAKIYLAENPVLVNGLSENRRGRKLYPGDVINIEGQTYTIE
jgi:S4 domain protein YaaA